MSDLEVSINNSKNKRRDILKKSINLTKKVFTILNILNYDPSDSQSNKQINKTELENKEGNIQEDLYFKASIKNNALLADLNWKNADKYLPKGLAKSLVSIEYGINPNEGGMVDNNNDNGEVVEE